MVLYSLQSAFLLKFSCLIFIRYLRTILSFRYSLLAKSNYRHFTNKYALVQYFRSNVISYHTDVFQIIDYIYKIAIKT